MSYAPSYVLKHAAKLTVAVLLLHCETVITETDSLVDSSVNLKFYQQIMFSRKKDMIIYPTTFQENTPVGK